jgi:archaellum biogenesis ATPase FlaH
MTLTPTLSLQGRGGKGDSCVYLLGLLDTFYDEDVPLTETLRLLNASLAQLRQLCERGALVIITTQLPPVEAALRVALVQRLKASADMIYRLNSTERDITLKVEKSY